MLDDAQLSETWEAWLTDQSPDAFELLLLNYEGLAMYHTRRAMARAPEHQDPQELASYARAGLMDAIRKFRPDGGASFKTYAAIRVPNAIKDGQRSQDPLTRSMRHQVKLVEAAIDEFWESRQREPSPDDLADSTGLPAEEVRTTLMMRQSLNASIEDLDEHVSHSVTHEGEIEVRIAEVRTRVAERIATLPPRCMAFFLAHYVEGLNMTESCKRMQIGSDWGRQTRHLTIASLTN